jgi:molybdopterin synthase sulfur carrier subunit
MNTNITKAKVKVEFYASMREVFQGKYREVELERPSNIRGVLNLLCNTYEQRHRIFDNSGQIRSDVNILKNGRHIKFLDSIETELKEGDIISIFPLIYGG